MPRFNGVPVNENVKPRFQGDPIATSSGSMQGSGGAISPAEKAPDISTRATRELPELFTSGILKGKDPAKVAQFAALAAITPNEQELGEIATTIFPEIGMQMDEKGNVLLADNSTGVRTVINRPGLSPTDLGQLFGIGSAMTPASRVGTGVIGYGLKQGAKQAGKGASASGGTQAVIEAAQAGSGGEFNPEEVAMAGLAQPAAQGIMEAAAVPAARAITGQIPAREQQIIKAGEATGVPVMTSDVIQPTTIAGGLTRQFAERIPFLGTGGKRGAQQTARKNAITEFADSLPPVNDKAIIDSLNAKKDSIKMAAGNRYERIKAQMDAAGSVPATNTLKKIDDTIAELSAPGKVVDEATVKDLQELKKALSQPQSFSLLRENRTYMGDLINNADPTGRSQLPTNSKRLLTQIKGAMSKDLDEFVKGKSPNEFFKYKQADEIYSEEAKILTKTRLKNVLDKGDVTPEQYRTLLFSSKPSEVRVLYNSLGNSGRSNARNAILNNVVEKAGGIDNMTPATINRELKKAGDQIDIFFKGADKEQLKGFQRLLEATKHADTSKAVTPTGQVMMAPLAAGVGAGVALQSPAVILATILGGSVATGAKIYESAPVRNLMLRLNNAQKGSPLEKALVQRLIPAIESAAQAGQQTGIDRQSSTSSQSRNR